MSRTFLAYLATALALLVLCWLYTTDTALDPGNGDPIQYLYAAQTFREGSGLRNYTFPHTYTQDVTGKPGALMTTWPPLYSITLALLGGGLQAARFVNAIGLWMTLLLMAILYREYGIGWPLILACELAFVAWVSDPQRTFLSAASETLFLPLTMLWMILLPRVRRDALLFAVSAVSGALVMTRYIGIVFVVMGGVYVASRAGRGLSALPDAPGGVVDHTELVRDTPPDRESGGWGLQGFIRAIIHHGRAAGLWTIGGPSVFADRLSAVDLACIAITYLGALLAGGATTLINPPSPRLLSPLVPVLVLLVWQGATALLNPL